MVEEVKKCYSHTKKKENERKKKCLCFPSETQALDSHATIRHFGLIHLHIHGYLLCGTVYERNGTFPPDWKGNSELEGEEGRRVAESLLSK